MYSSNQSGFSSRMTSPFQPTPGLLDGASLPGQKPYADQLGVKQKDWKDLQVLAQYCSAWAQTASKADMRDAKVVARLPHLSMPHVEKNLTASEQTLLKLVSVMSKAVPAAGPKDNPLLELRDALVAKASAQRPGANANIKLNAERCLSAALLLTRQLPLRHARSASNMLPVLSQLLRGLYSQLGDDGVSKVINNLYDQVGFLPHQKPTTSFGRVTPGLHANIQSFASQLHAGLDHIANPPKVSKLVAAPKTCNISPVMKINQVIGTEHLERSAWLASLTSAFGAAGEEKAEYLYNTYSALDLQTFKAVTEIIARFNSDKLSMPLFLELSALSAADNAKIHALALDSQRAENGVGRELLRFTKESVSSSAQNLTGALSEIVKQGLKRAKVVNQANVLLVDKFLQMQAAKLATNTQQAFQIQSEVVEQIKQILRSVTPEQSAAAGSFLKNYSQMARMGNTRTQSLQNIRANAAALQAYIDLVLPKEKDVTSGDAPSNKDRATQQTALRQFCEQCVTQAVHTAFVEVNRRQDITLPLMHRAMADQADPRKVDPLALVLSARILGVRNVEDLSSQLMDARLISALLDAAQADAHTDSSMSEKELCDALQNPKFEDVPHAAEHDSTVRFGQPSEQVRFDLRGAGKLLAIQLGLSAVDGAVPPPKIENSTLSLWQRVNAQIIQDGNSLAGLATNLHSASWYVRNKPLVSDLVSDQKRRVDNRSVTEKVPAERSLMSQLLGSAAAEQVDTNDRVIEILGAELDSVTNTTLSKLEGQSLSEDALHALLNQVSQVLRSLSYMEQNPTEKTRYHYVVENMLEVKALDSAISGLGENDLALAKAQVAVNETSALLRQARQKNQRARIALDAAQTVLKDHVAKFEAQKADAVREIEEAQALLDTALRKRNDTATPMEASEMSEGILLTDLQNRWTAELSSLETQVNGSQLKVEEFSEAHGATATRLQAAEASEAQARQDQAIAKENVQHFEQTVLKALQPCMYSPLHRDGAVKNYAISMMKKRIGESAYEKRVTDMSQQVPSTIAMNQLLAAARTLNLTQGQMSDAALTTFTSILENVVNKGWAVLPGGVPGDLGLRRNPLWQDTASARGLEKVSKEIYGTYAADGQELARSEFVKSLYNAMPPQLLEVLLPAHIRENQGINSDYAYLQDDIEGLLDHHHKNLVAKNVPAAGSISITRPLGYSDNVYLYDDQHSFKNELPTTGFMSVAIKQNRNGGYAVRVFDAKNEFKDYPNISPAATEYVTRQLANAVSRDRQVFAEKLTQYLNHPKPKTDLVNAGKGRLLGEINTWAMQAKAEDEPKLLTIPLLPYRRDGADVEAVLHWVGLVAAYNKGGEVEVSFVDSLGDKVRPGAGNDWQASALKAFSEAGLSVKQHDLSHQHQHDLRLCGPVLTSVFRDVMSRWSEAPQQGIPDRVAEQSGLALRVNDVQNWQAYEKSIDGGDEVRLPFSVRQAWGC